MQTRSFFGSSIVSRSSAYAATSTLFLAAILTASGCGPSNTNATTGGGGSAPACVVPADSKPTMTFTKIGNPTWEFVDAHQYTAECGMNYDQLAATNAMILPAPNHQAHPMLGIGPGASHPGPYDHEFRDGLTKLGFADRTVFDAIEATWPKCIFATWMIVPTADAPVGSSPDFTSGPIIPNTLFPIQISFQGYLDGTKNPATPYDSKIPALDVNLTPPFTVDGHSHIPWFLYEDTNTLLEQCGKHEFQGSFTDAKGNGWEFTTTFYLDG